MSRDPKSDDKKTDFVSPIWAEDTEHTSTDSLDATTDRIEITSTVQRALRSSGVKKKASLLVLYGQEVGRVIPLDKPAMTIGRSSTCDEVIDGEGVSRCHVKIRVTDDDKFIVTDLGSTNGTFIQGERIGEAVMHDGDKVLLGRRMVLKFTFHDTFDETYFQEMYESSTRDALTGAHNRKFLAEKIVSEISFARRHRIPFTLLILDLDHFKNVNDKHGHLSGDQALRTVVSVITGLIRAEDILARYGGEEFAIVAPGTDFAGAKVLAERIRSRIAVEPIPVIEKEGEPFFITVSIGIATVPPKAIVQSTAVIAVADENLYRAKQGGRNQVVGSLLE